MWRRRTTNFVSPLESSESKFNICRGKPSLCIHLAFMSPTAAFRSCVRVGLPCCVLLGFLPSLLLVISLCVVRADAVLAARFARRLHPRLLLRTSPRCARCRWHLRDGRLVGGAHRHSSRPAMGRPDLNKVLKLMHASEGSHPLTPKRTWPVCHACNARRPQERGPS